MSENSAIARDSAAAADSRPNNPDSDATPAMEPIPDDLRLLVSHRLSVAADAPLEEIQKFFGSQDLEFVAVVEHGRAIGLCARRQIGIVLGSRYGFSLFSRNPVRDYLVPDALVVRVGDSIHQILRRLSARPDESFYDDVLLEDKDGTFLGSIFVRNLVRLQQGLLIENIRQLEQNRAEIERKNTQMERELAMAGDVQQAMLPLIYPVFPSPSGDGPGALRFHHRYLPAGKVSGDFFHVSRISDRRAGVFICDVMGHGVRSAMITSMLRALVEELQGDADEPGQLLERLNEDLFAILHQNDETMYASGIYMLVDTATLKVRWASAGHPSPLHLLKRKRSVELLSLPREKRGKVMGLTASSVYETCETALEPGDRLLLYTDGIYEVFRGSEEFGVNGVMAALRRNFTSPTPQLLDQIVRAARAFAESDHFEDDVCLLAVDTGQ